MGYKVIFLGLVNFFDPQTGSGKLLLLPDGRNPANPHIPPHSANIFVIDPQIQDSSQWPAEPDPVCAHINVSKFAISTPSTITLSAQEVTGSSSGGGSRGRLNTSKQDGLVPLLKGIDPQFEIDENDVDTIAQIPIIEGELAAFKLADEAVVSQLSVKFDDLMTITMTPDDGSAAKTLILRKGAEIVIGNTSKIGHAPAPDEVSHFFLYGQLEKHRDGSRLVEPPLNPTLDEISSAHPYIAFIRDSQLAVPLPGCSVTGCCLCCEP